jgi:hypothetical protein
MKLHELRSFKKSFGSIGDIKTFLDVNLGSPSEKFLEAESLLIFSSRTQHTWLIATERALYCVFDILKEGSPRVKWHIPERYLVSEDKKKLIVKISTGDDSDLSGFIIINGKHPRKYSKMLFAQLSIERSIEIMLRKAFRL